MRALVVDRPGDDVRPRIAERPVPNPGPGQVLIEVAYVAVNWSDIQKRQGIYPDRVDYPVVLGAEVSGRVVAAGAGVPRRHLGRQTAALCGPRLVGGGADFVAVPLEYLVPLPRGVDLLAATALPLATLTAYHLLHTAHRVRKAEVVLVHAAAGSVGLATVQTARLRGATVIGTVGSAAKVDAPRRFGAALVIDRSREEFVETAMAFTGDRGVDLVIDSLGGEILPRSFDCLRRYGHLVNIGEASGEPDFPVRKKLYERSTSMAGFELLHAEPGSSRWRRGLRWVASRVAAGQLTVPVAGTIPLDQAGRAHEALESRGTIGKLMLEVNAGHAGWA
jgi:NADPH2:quinone reductase